MPSEFDAELLAEITATFAAGAMTLPGPAARGDWKTLLASGEAALAEFEAALPAHPEISRLGYPAAAGDGAAVALRWYAPAGRAAPGSGVARRARADRLRVLGSL